MLTSDELLKNLLKENRELSELVEKKFSPVHFEELNYRPKNGVWSAAECFDHLISTNNYYISLIEEALASDKKIWGGDKPFSHTVSGRLLMNSMNPENAKKFKTPKLFRPANRVYTKQVIKYFLDQNKIIYNLLEKAQGLSLGEIKIKSYAGKLVRLNLGECFQLINLHEKRHIKQAQKILKI